VNPTILIVDDEKHTRDGLRAALEESFEVYVAADIGGALGVLERETVDLVLTDLRLGGEDGMALVDKVLGLPHSADRDHDDGLRFRGRGGGGDEARGV